MGWRGKSDAKKKARTRRQAANQMISAHRVGFGICCSASYQRGQEERKRRTTFCSWCLGSDGRGTAEDEKLAAGYQSWGGPVHSW